MNTNDPPDGGFRRITCAEFEARAGLPRNMATGE